MIGVGIYNKVESPVTICEYLSINICSQNKLGMLLRIKCFIVNSTKHFCIYIRYLPQIFVLLQPLYKMHELRFFYVILSTYILCSYI